MQEAPVLRPLGVGDMIDRTLRLVRANIVLFISISVIPALIVEIMQRASGLSQTIDANNFSQLFDPRASAVSQRTFVLPNGPVVLAVGLVAGAVSLIVYSAITAAFAERYLGRTVSIGEAYSRGLRAVPAVLFSVLAFFIALGVVFVAFFLIAAVASSAALAVIGLIVGLIAFFFFLPWAFLSLAVLGPVIVIERLGPIAAIRRSFHLMDRSRWRALGLYILVLIISGILGLIFSLVFLASFVTEPTARTVLQTVASVAASAISGPLTYGAFVILYYDLRVRREAFDLQLAAEALPREG